MSFSTTLSRKQTPAMALPSCSSLLRSPPIWGSLAPPKYHCSRQCCSGLLLCHRLCHCNAFRCRLQLWTLHPLWHFKSSQVLSSLHPLHRPPRLWTKRSESHKWLHLLLYACATRGVVQVLRHLRQRLPRRRSQNLTIIDFNN